MERRSLTEPVAGMTATASLPTDLYAAAQLYAGEQLQSLLVATIDLGLVIDHAHWNVQGVGSDALHVLFDDLSDALGRHRALLAQRAVELGAAPDGRPGTVAADSRLPEPGNGPLLARDAAAAIADRLDHAADLVRDQLSRLSASDPVTRHVLIGLAQLIERHRSMLRRLGIQE
jgi:starvation-inducible DNA-binding protein